MNNKNLAPIALFTYNRPWHLKETISSLQNNELAKNTDLFIFSDGPKSSTEDKIISEIRQYIHNIKGFNSVTIKEQPSNLGLAKSIISGVSDLLTIYCKIIVLEDDLIVSSDFIEYMNSALIHYEKVTEVFSISAYCAPIKIGNYHYQTFFFKRINSWGWATWKDRWDTVDWELKDFNEFISNSKNRNSFNKGGKDLTMMLLKYKSGMVDSWAIRFNYACFKQGKINLYPIKSKISNSGIDNSGTNTRKSNKFNTLLYQVKINVEAPIVEDRTISNAYARFLSPSLFRQIFNWLKIKRFIIKMK